MVLGPALDRRAVIDRDESVGARKEHRKLGAALARTSRELVALDADVVNAALADASIADLKAWLREAQGARGFFAEVTRLIEQRLARHSAPAL
jgi:hypothetical protein